MIREQWASRRAFLAITGTALSALAGCTDGDETETTTTRSTNSQTDLDLREANVVDVTYESADDDVFQFDVTLFHDDDGEDGYADWWQIETLDRTQLGRRSLLHAHGTQPFTRSSSINIPSEVNCVVVRGHDQTHGYGGQVYLVNLENETNRPVEQGSEPETFKPKECP